MPEPLYTAENCKPSFQLLWTLALFWNAPAPDASTWLDHVKEIVEPTVYAFSNITNAAQR